MMSNYIEYIYIGKKFLLFSPVPTVLNFCVIFGAIENGRLVFCSRVYFAAVKNPLFQKVGWLHRGSWYRQTPRPACRKLELVLIDQLHTLDTKPTKVRTSRGDDRWARW